MTNPSLFIYFKTKRLLIFPCARRNARGGAVHWRNSRNRQCCVTSDPLRRVICLRVATIRGVRMRPLNDADLRETSTFEILGEENTETMCSRRQSLFALVNARKKTFLRSKLSLCCVCHAFCPAAIPWKAFNNGMWQCCIRVSCVQPFIYDDVTKRLVKCAAAKWNYTEFNYKAQFGKLFCNRYFKHLNENYNNELLTISC